MPDELSVRQWQEQFKAGAFDSPEEAGKPLPAPERLENKSQKRKEPER